jgi:hypothetical protein
VTWQQRAACAHPAVAPADFSPVHEKTGQVDLERARRVAAAICGPCPVRHHCLSQAIRMAANNTGPQEIVWGGLWWPALKSHTPIDLLAACDEPARQETAA